MFGCVEPLCFGVQKSHLQTPVLGAVGPSVPEHLRVVVETVFEIFLNSDFSCYSHFREAKLLKLTRFFLRFCRSLGSLVWGGWKDFLGISEGF